MTIKDTIEALPWYHRAAVDQLISAWDRENTLTRFLQGAGNKEELEAVIDDLKYQDWSMLGGPAAEPRPGDPEPAEDPETPTEPAAPVQDDSAGDDK